MLRIRCRLLGEPGRGFARISLSIFSRLFSRRSRASSSRSFVVSPPSPRPASRAACFTHNAIVQGVGPNSRDSSGMLRPARCSATSSCRNSRVYLFEVLDLAITDSSYAYCKESTEPGEDHSRESIWDGVPFQSLM